MSNKLTNGKVTDQTNSLVKEKVKTDKGKSKKLKKKVYKRELRRLQVELVKLQEWIKQKGLKVVVVFEGRDAAGKGGVIKRITECLNPRVCKVVALGTPTERENPMVFSTLCAISASRRGDDPV